MEFDLTWLLWGLPLAFGLGWLASRFDLRQWRIESRQAPRAYFRGLNHLLNEQQDQAIDAFIEAVQNDPDTSELHFALGNLFRRRGDYDRAVRVHEHLLARGDLAEKDHQRAQHALALDFLKAGLLDRAEQALVKLEGTPYEGEARLALLAIYERSRDWAHAHTVSGQLEASGQGSFQLRQAQHRCEMADTLLRNNQMVDALTLLKQLVQDTPQSARAWIALADTCQRLGNTRGALDALVGLSTHTPGHLPLVAHNLVQWARVCQDEALADRLLKHHQATHPPSLDVTQALVSLQTDTAVGRALYIEHLKKERSLVAATLWLAGSPLGSDEQEPYLRAALDKAVEPLKRYRCAACGFESRQYFWQCPGCQNWDSYPPLRVEEL